VPDVAVAVARAAYVLCVAAVAAFGWTACKSQRDEDLADQLKKFSERDMQVRYGWSDMEQRGVVELFKNPGKLRVDATIDGETLVLIFHDSEALSCDLKQSRVLCEREVEGPDAAFLLGYAHAVMALPNSLNLLTDVPSDIEIKELDPKPLAARTILGRRASCFEVHPSPYQGDYELCFDDDGALTFAELSGPGGEKHTLQALEIGSDVEPDAFSYELDSARSSDPLR
jgi:hypothetical protein